MPNKTVRNLRSVDNSQAYTIVRAAYSQAVGASAVDTLNLKDFVDSGVAFESLSMSRDKFVKALIDQTVNFYNDESYKNNYDDPYYVESRRFANIVQAINIQAPQVQESHAWGNLAPYDDSGTTRKVTVGTYEVNPPIVDTSYFTKSVSWELPIAITEEQLTDAFKSEEELRGFVDYIFVVVDNALTQHREDMNAANRNSFMAHKINAQRTGVGGIHKVDLLAKYNAERGGLITSVAAFLADPAALRFASAQIMLYKEYLRKQSQLFNTKGLVKFIPQDRMVIEVNSAFENAMLETALSTTYNESIVALPDHYSVPAWQGFGVDSVASGTSAAAFNQVSKIDVTLDIQSSGSNVNVSQSGIVALIADKTAIMHTIRQSDVVSQYFPFEHLELYAYQNRDQYMNNLAQNAVVFTIEEPVTPPVSQIRMNMKG